MIFTSPTGPTLLLSERFYFHTLVGVPPLLSPPFPAIIVILWASFCLQHSHASCFQFLPFIVPFSAFPCFFLHFITFSSLFCISFSISYSCPFTVYSGSFSSTFRFFLLFSVSHFNFPFWSSHLILGKPAPSLLFVLPFNLLSVSAKLKRFNSPQKRSYHPGEMAPLRSPYDFDDEGNATSTSTTEPSSSGFRSSVTSRFTTTDASETFGDEDSSVPGAWLKY